MFLSSSLLTSSSSTYILFSSGNRSCFSAMARIVPSSSTKASPKLSKEIGGGAFGFSSFLSLAGTLIADYTSFEEALEEEAYRRHVLHRRRFHWGRLLLWL